MKPLSKYRQETDPEIKDSLKFVLTMMALTWGINNFPELKQYAADMIVQLHKILGSWLLILSIDGETNETIFLLEKLKW